MPSLPKDFLNSLAYIPNFNEEAFIKVHNDGNTPTSVRFNPFKKTTSLLKLENKVPWTTDAYYLKERPVFTGDPNFHAGCYYVQEASSMFIEYALKQTIDFNKEIYALDACAAPGGKSTILSSLINNTSVLVSNEVIKSRTEILSYNLAKWGNCNHVVTGSETTSFSTVKGLFDVVLVDAPCSGSGLFRKQPEAINEWSLAAVTQCSTRQKTILADLVGTVKPDGYLIYSTCSYSQEENEDIVKWLIKDHHAEIVKINIEDSWGIEDTGFGFRFYPQNLMGEGFFCAVLKVNGNNHFQGFTKKNEFKTTSKTENEVINEFVNLENQHELINHSDEFKLMNTNTLQFVNTLKKHLYFKQVGTSIGQIKQGSLIPHHFLALSNHLQPKVDFLELSDAQAIQYLKKEPFDFENKETGLKLVKNHNFGIGWAKVLNNRVNNYLPPNYRIFNKDIQLWE